MRTCAYAAKVPVEKVEDAVPVEMAALGADVHVIGARDNGPFARLVAAGVEAIEVLWRRVRIVAPRKEEHGRRRKFANVSHRCELGQTQAETPLGDPDDAAAEALEPGRIAAAHARAERGVQVVVHAFKDDSPALARAR